MWRERGCYRIECVSSNSENESLVSRDKHIVLFWLFGPEKECIQWSGHCMVLLHTPKTRGL